MEYYRTGICLHNFLLSYYLTPQVESLDPLSGGGFLLAH